MSDKKKEDSSLKGWLTKQLPSRIEQVWKGVSPERFMHVAFASLYTNPDLQKCSPFSVLNAMVKCAQLNLEPDGRMAYLVPFAQNDKDGKLIRYNCLFILGYMGMIQIARRSGEVADIQAEVVRRGDEFDYEYGSNKFLRHRPRVWTEDNSSITHVWSFVTFTNGHKDFRVQPREWIDWIRSRSKTPNKGPWKTDFPAMGKKALFREHFKWLPFSAETLSKLNSDDERIIDIDAEKIGPRSLGPSGTEPFADTGGFGSEPEPSAESDALPQEENPFGGEYPNSVRTESPDDSGDQSEDGVAAGAKSSNPPRGGLFK